MHSHKWVPTERTERVSHHISHPQDEPRPATYRYWRCSRCDKERSFYRSPVEYQRHLHRAAAAFAAGVALALADVFAFQTIWLFVAGAFLCAPLVVPFATVLGASAVSYGFARGSR